MEKNKTSNFSKVATGGISFGAALAMIISYTAWESIPWAILHGILSWIYVIFYAIAH